MIPPSTPPRKTVAMQPVTPSSSRCHKKHSRSRPATSPFLTPRSSRKHAADVIIPSPKNPLVNFLPTPLTVGRGRKNLNFGVAIPPSSKSRNLTAALEALSEPKEALPVEQPATSPPRPSTPEQQIVHEASTPCSSGLGILHSDDSSIQVVDVGFLKRIPRKKLPNPFLELDSSRPTSVRSDVDLATQMELVNHRTGERKVRTLLEEQRKFKPRKLDFTLAVKQPVKVNYNVTNKFVTKNMGKAFTLEDTNKLGFSIFSDGDSSS